jgi:predicted SprT family Zn-dependent metalloprotease
MYVDLSEDNKPFYGNRSSCCCAEWYTETTRLTENKTLNEWRCKKCKKKCTIVNLKPFTNKD